MFLNSGAEKIFGNVGQLLNKRDISNKVQTSVESNTKCRIKSIAIIRDH